MEINFKLVSKLQKKKKRLSNFHKKLKTIGILVHNFESSIFEIVFVDSEKEWKYICYVRFQNLSDFFFGKNAKLTL